MLKALDVAKFFLYVMQDEEDLGKTKLNKLMYFAQGYYLKRRGVPLFSEDILAWKFGPVVRNIVNEFDDIKKNNHSTIDISKYNESEIDTILDVIREYGKYSAKYLTNETHKMGMPWSEVYVEGRNDVVIPIKLIKKYFDNIDDITSNEINFDEEEFVGYTDKDGYLVLPSEYDD